MGHFSVEIYAPPGSTLSGNQQLSFSLQLQKPNPERTLMFGTFVSAVSGHKRAISKAVPLAPRDLALKSFQMQRFLALHPESRPEQDHFVTLKAIKSSFAQPLHAAVLVETERISTYAVSSSFPVQQAGSWRSHAAGI